MKRRSGESSEGSNEAARGQSGEGWALGDEKAGIGIKPLNWTEILLYWNRVGCNSVKRGGPEEVRGRER